MDGVHCQQVFDCKAKFWCVCFLDNNNNKKERKGELRIRKNKHRK